MLNIIKNMITEKQNQILSDDMILSESSKIDLLDDSLILEDSEKEIKEDETEQEDVKEDDNIEDEKEDDEKQEEDLDIELDDEEGNDISTDNEFNNDLPEIEDDDILTTEINLASNTPVDTLPVPPQSALDAIADDDILSARVDSGFGDETEPSEDISDEGNPLDSPEPEINQSEDDDLLNSSIDDEENEDIENDQKPESKEDESMEESVDLLNEFIESESKIEDIKESSDDILDQTFDLFQEEIVMDGNESSSENTDKAKEDSTVTAAVKDKVAEVEGEEQSSEEIKEVPMEEPSDSDIEDIEDEQSIDDIDNEANADTKSKIYKKLSDLTKNIEDVKVQVTELIQ